MVWRGLSGVWLTKDTEGHVRRIDPGAHGESVTLGNARLESLEQRGVVGTQKRLLVKARAEGTSCRLLLMKRRKMPEARLLQATSAHHSEPCAGQDTSQQRCGHSHSLLTHSSLPKWRCCPGRQSERAPAAQQNALVRIEVSGVWEFDWGCRLNWSWVTVTD